MTHSAITTSTTRIPKRSWVDNNGKRWTEIRFDIISGGGERFVRQVSVTLGMHFDFCLGCYVIDKDMGPELTQEIFRQYPSLATIHNINIIPTSNRVIH